MTGYFSEWFRYFLFGVWVLDITLIFLIAHLSRDIQQIKMRLERDGWLVSDEEEQLRGSQRSHQAKSRGM